MKNETGKWTVNKMSLHETEQKGEVRLTIFILCLQDKKKWALKRLYISWNISAELLMVVLQVDDIAYQSINNVLAFMCKEELQSLWVGFPKAGSPWKNT